MTHRVQCVALSACGYPQSEIWKMLNVLTNNSQFPNWQWMTQRQCVYELSYWHNTQLICVKRVKNSWMIISISSYVRISLIQLNAIVTFCVGRLLRVISYLLFLLLCVYISQCKFHPFISFQDHHPLVQHVLLHTTGSSMYEIKLLKCTYVHLSLFHSNVSNIQHNEVRIIWHL